MVFKIGTADKNKLSLFLVIELTILILLFGMKTVLYSPVDRPLTSITVVIVGLFIASLLSQKKQADNTEILDKNQIVEKK